MLRSFLNARAIKWGPVLQRYFERKGIRVENVTETGATLSFDGAEALLKGVRSALLLGIIETAGWIAVGIGIGRLIR